VSPRRAWGIFREEAHSPGRELDDTQILRRTAEALGAHGFTVALKSPAELDRETEWRPPFVFLMCERLRPLARLREWERLGVRLVNSPVAVLNTYRARMQRLWAEAGIPAPGSRIVRTSRTGNGHPGPAWVKRADVHYTQTGDVVFTEGEAAVREALAALADRGIRRAVIQEHVPGDLIKFYGVGSDRVSSGPEPWFRWFYHRDQQLAGHRFDPDTLAAIARRAAAVLGLEIFGGDAIARPDGTLSLIDLNAWPSFALYRDEAAERIAGYLDARFSKE
jgi:glutathione synthase/RimK-type ligase-like ATP-grasp enzyme